MIGTYLAYFDRFVSSAGATYLKRELGLSDAGFGLLAGTLFAVAYAAGALAFGHWSRRRPPAPFLIGGIGAWTAGIVALGYATSPGHFATAQIVAGLGQAAFVPAAVAVITASGDQRRIGRVTSRFSIASSLGRSSAALTAGAIIAAIATVVVAAPFGLPAAWRTTFLLTSLPNLVLIAALAIVLRRPEGTAPPVRTARTSFRVGTQAQLSLFAAACAAVVVIQSAAIWFPTLLVRLHALDPARAAILAGVVTLVTAPLGQLFGGRLLDRMVPLGVAPTQIVMGGIAVGGVALAMLIASPPLPAALVLLGIANLSLGIASVSALAGVQRATAIGDRHRINGYFFATVTLVGLGTGPALTGLLSDASADPATALPRALAIVALAMFCVAMAAHLFSRRARDKP
ncbi:MFS transporter [Sphingomonas sp. AX6]|uniref:MFS transporter n=1 Tax=Sphingomonas sp. AX6 TaxID=2653171 RepID=UPI0012F2DA92|nr:MFS transporter [Sphingomonas sp. AX6]VXC81853.1 putative MFS transporter [Sphingomonas sp. AX6]